MPACYWLMIACNVHRAAAALVPARARAACRLLFVIALIVNIGMWLERYVIVVTSLHRDFLPSAWGMYYGTVWDYATFFGTIGLFFSLLFLFIRFLPVISISEHARDSSAKPDVNEDVRNANGIHSTD